jgi:hypothetical protein
MCGCTYDTEFVSQSEIEQVMEAEEEEIPVETEPYELPTDEAGMLVCPKHGKRRYGWRSVGRHHEWDGWNPLQVERFVVFGEIPTFKATPLVRPKHDERMNQDPERVYFTIKQSRNPNGTERVVTDREITQDMKDDARRRLDLFDRTGWEVRDAQVKSIWD